MPRGLQTNAEGRRTTSTAILRHAVSILERRARVEEVPHAVAIHRQGLRLPARKDREEQISLRKEEQGSVVGQDIIPMQLPQQLATAEEELAVPVGKQSRGDYQTAKGGVLEPQQEVQRHGGGQQLAVQEHPHAHLIGRSTQDQHAQGCSPLLPRNTEGFTRLNPAQ